MATDLAQIWPYAFAALAFMLVLQRLRRNFGAQPVRPVSMGIRIGLLAVLGASMVPLGLGSTAFLAAEIGGLAAGLGLGFWAGGRTRYEMRDGRLFYVPHTYTGIAVSLLLVGRVVYRMAWMYSHPAWAAGQEAVLPQSGAAGPIVRSPSTAGLLCVVVGYYGYFYGRVLWKSKRIGPEDLEA